MVLGLGLRFRVWGFQALGLLLHELTHLGLQLGALPLIDYEVSWHSLLLEGLVAQVNVVAVVVVVVVLAASGGEQLSSSRSSRSHRQSVVVIGVTVSSSFVQMMV